MAEHSIAFCKKDDVDDLIRFIADYWRKDHIFVRDRRVFDFQHKLDDENYNFVIARQGSEVVACLGFAAIEQYDLSDKKWSGHQHPFFGKGIWLCLWKSRQDVAAGMGFYLYRFLEENLEPEWVATAGISRYSVEAFKMFRWEPAVEMKHYFRPNAGLAPADFTLARPDLSLSVPGNSEAPLYTLKQVTWNEIKKLNTNGAVPAKHPGYFRGRYFDHPVYTYDVWAIENTLGPQYYLIVRVAEVPEGRCLRIIDIYGDIRSAAQVENQDIFFQTYPGIQYVDFLCEGIDHDLLQGLGLRLKAEEEIVPEYFSPFLKENITIKAAVSKAIPGFYFCKGDADQDRPS
jgi:hypothetical protein